MNVKNTIIGLVLIFGIGVFSVLYFGEDPKSNSTHDNGNNKSGNDISSTSPIYQNGSGKQKKNKSETPDNEQKQEENPSGLPVAVSAVNVNNILDLITSSEDKFPNETFGLTSGTVRRVNHYWTWVVAFPKVTEKLTSQKLKEWDYELTDELLNRVIVPSVYAQQESMNPILEKLITNHRDEDIYQVKEKRKALYDMITHYRDDETARFVMENARSGSISAIKSLIYYYDDPRVIQQLDYTIRNTKNEEIRRDAERARRKIKFLRNSGPEELLERIKSQLTGQIRYHWEELKVARKTDMKELIPYLRDFMDSMEVRDGSHSLSLKKNDPDRLMTLQEKFKDPVYNQMLFTLKYLGSDLSEEQQKHLRKYGFALSKEEARSILREKALLK